MLAAADSIASSGLDQRGPACSDGKTNYAPSWRTSATGSVPKRAPSA
jgi:hypothetical protein